MLHNIRYRQVTVPLTDGVTMDVTREEFFILYRAMVDSPEKSSQHAALLNALAKVNV